MITSPKPQMKVLVVDDDVRLLELLKDFLSSFGYSVSTATRPSAALEALKKNPDLVILDVMLPEMSGFDLCKEIRKTSQVPIVMLTARGDLTDKVVGLELGADDYMPKPFEPRELVARIQTILRRTQAHQQPQERSVLKFHDLEILLDSRNVKLSGELLDFSTLEFDVLCLLAQKPGQPLSRDQIMETLRGSNWTAFDRSVDVLLSRIRQKLKDDPKHPRFIKTVWGFGYVFIGHARHD